jgi:hypothetical protein
MTRILASILAAACVLLASCTPAQWAGLQAADTIVKGACGAILATNGTPTQDTLAALQSVEKQLVELAASKASEHADPAIVAAIQAGLEANALAMRELSRQLLALAARTAEPVAPALPATAPK